jgi:hypothetical protein
VNTCNVLEPLLGSSGYSKPPLRRGDSNCLPFAEAVISDFVILSALLVDRESVFTGETGHTAGMRPGNEFWLGSPGRLAAAPYIR